MKKGLFFLVLVLILGFEANSQTIVGTSPENKNVILEEFTGIHCGYCPDGHAISQAIQNNNPGDVFLINIHTGGYSTPGAGEPDFRTDFGSAIAGQSGLTGYPAGTVNRHLFSGLSQGSGTAMGRYNWENASNQTLAQSSYVNVAVEAEIDVASRQLTVHVETYYTGNSPQSTNYLNVALIQNNTLGPQSGGGMGDNYVHMHRLVHMITGQWGEEISPTTTGTFIDKTYTYTLPLDYRDVEVVIPDMEIVAFISETTQEIPSGSGCIPTYIVANDNDAGIVDVSSHETSCGAPLSPSVTISNGGNNDITSLNINYSINGGTVETYTWTGSISTFDTETIELPAIPFTLETNNTINVTIQDDDNNSNNSGSTTFGVAPESSHVVTMSFNSGPNGVGCSWNVKDTDGTTLYSGGPYGNNQSVSEVFHLAPGCYGFNVMNPNGNGSGVIDLTDAEGTEIYHTVGDFEFEDVQNFSTFSSAPLVVFNPGQGEENISVSTEIVLSFNEPVRMIDDNLITDPASFINIITVPSIETIEFTAEINNDNDVITITPNENLPVNTFIKVTVSGSTIENFYDDEFASDNATFKTEESNGVSAIFSEINIFPNPAKNFISISNAKNSNLNIIDIYGKTVLTSYIKSNKEEINIKDLSSGIYILKLELDGKTSERKAIITK